MEGGVSCTLSELAVMEVSTDLAVREWPGRPVAIPVAFDTTNHMRSCARMVGLLSRVLYALSISDRGYRAKSSHAPDRVVWLLRATISTGLAVRAWPGRLVAIPVAFDTTSIRVRI